MLASVQPSVSNFDRRSELRLSESGTMLASVQPSVSNFDRRSKTKQGRRSRASPAPFYFFDFKRLFDAYPRGLAKPEMVQLQKNDSFKRIVCQL
jgi:hypothetical protein